MLSKKQGVRLVTVVFVLCVIGVLLFYNIKITTNHYKYNDTKLDTIAKFEEQSFKNTTKGTAYSQVGVYNTLFDIDKENDQYNEDMLIETDTGYRNYKESRQLYKNPYVHTIKIGEGLDVAKDNVMISKYLYKKFHIQIPDVAFSNITTGSGIISLSKYDGIFDYSKCYVEDDTISIVSKGSKDKVGNIKLYYNDGNYLVFYKNRGSSTLEEEEPSSIGVSLKAYSWLCYGVDTKYKNIYDVVNLEINKEKYKNSEETKTQKFSNIVYDEYEYIVLYRKDGLPLISIRNS